MKWYSVKTHRPTLVCALTLVRIECLNGYSYLALAEYDCGWKDWGHKDPIENDGIRVTHFCIPDPVEIE